MVMKHIEYECHSRDGLTMYAQGWMPGDHPDAVFCLVHGLGEHSGRYHHFGEYLCENNFALLSFDLRGHGQSGGARGHADSFEELVSDVDCFLEYASKMYPDIPHFLYGHSLGGTLVIHHAMTGKGNYRGVIVTAPMFRPAFEPPGWKITLGRLVQGIAPKLTLSNEVNVDHLSRNPDVILKGMCDPWVHDRISTRLGICFLDAGLQALEVTSEFPFDLLLMHGTDDKITCHKSTTEFAETAGPSCTLKLWEDLYHELHNEPEKDEIFDFVVEWAKERI